MFYGNSLAHHKTDIATDLSHCLPAMDQHGTELMSSRITATAALGVSGVYRPLVSRHCLLDVMVVGEKS